MSISLHRSPSLVVEICKIGAMFSTPWVDEVLMLNHVHDLNMSKLLVLQGIDMAIVYMRVLSNVHKYSRVVFGRAEM